MANLRDVDNMYVQKKVSVTSHEVTSHSLKLFIAALRELRFSLGDDYGNPYWEYFRRVTGLYRYEHLQCPIALSDPGSLNVNVVQELGTRYEKHQVIYPSSDKEFEKVFESLQACLSSDENPLLDGLAMAFENFGEEVFNGKISVLTENSKIELVAGALESAYPFVDKWREYICVPRQLRKFFFEGQIVAFGTPRNLAYSGKQWLLSTPRANAYHFLTFDFQNNVIDLPVAFPRVNKPKIIDALVKKYSSPGSQHNTPQVETFVEDTNFEDSELDLPQDKIESDLVTDEILDESEIVEAQMLTLEGDKRVWVDVGISASYLIVDLDDDRKVLTVAGNEIEIGNFYLYREGDADFIPEVANLVMGSQSLTLRPAQSKWKSRLKWKVQIHGLTVVADKLVEHGSSIANIPNLRNWISTRNICTQNESDFKAITKYLGIENESLLLWQQMGEIRSAHRKAGRLVKRELIRLVTESDNLEQLLDDGWEEFKLEFDQNTTLVAREILEISNETHLMNGSMIGMVEEFGGVS